MNRTGGRDELSCILFLREPDAKSLSRLHALRHVNESPAAGDAILQKFRSADFMSRHTDAVLQNQIDKTASRPVQILRQQRVG